MLYCFCRNDNKNKEIRAVAHHNTILNQMVAILPRHDFEKMAKIHHLGGKFRTFSRWSQFMALMIGQLSGRVSLRDLVENIATKSRRLYHLGIKSVSRSNLARANDQQPAVLYEIMFGKLLDRCRTLAPGKRFKFKSKLYLLDATMIELCLSVFPWAKYTKSKGAVKVHVGLDANGYLPSFLSVTDGKKHEIEWARALQLPKGSFAVFDRGFTDYDWYASLIKNGIFFVTRLKSNAKFRLGWKRSGRKAAGIKADREIFLGDIATPLRLIEYTDPETGTDYRFVTNAFHLPAKTVADLYKERWQIELFFKWIKQNLKVKTFLGTSRNAVLTQLWVAMIVYLLLAFLKFKAKLGQSLSGILRLLQLNLFSRRDFMSLFKLPETQVVENRQFSLW